MIYYLVTDNSKPSWGVGIIYHHVSILVKYGYSAIVLHNSPGFKIGWLDLNLQISYFSEVEFTSEDYLVVPEVMAFEYDFAKYPCRKILFVQALAYLFYGFKLGQNHLLQGFRHAMIIMPHMIVPVNKYTHLPVTLIPPFIADYFYKDLKKLHKREKIILIYPKAHLQEFDLIRFILLSSGIIFSDTFLTRNFTEKWRLIEMRGLSHRQSAELLKKASFLITTNSFEAFNTTVPEAMASGCINICYEAFGPKDYLVNNFNAFVFNNNDAITLSETLLELIRNYSCKKDLINQMRNQARETANLYRKEYMENRLIQYFKTKNFD
jgi:hypothetical protein